MLKEYREHVAERASKNILPKPLNVFQVTQLIELIKDPPIGEEEFLMHLLINCIPPGVDESASVKANFLSDLAKNKTSSPLIAPEKAVKILGTMQGGYNIQYLIELLDDKKLAIFSAEALSYTLLIFDHFYDIEKKYKTGNVFAKKILHAWANAEWFMRRPQLSKKITVVAFKVPGETNTDDLSPAIDAWSRPDIPLHALSMLKYPRKGIQPDEVGNIGPIKQINLLKKIGYPLAYVGDIVGTGSSRKSATNSLIWYMGECIPYVPNKKRGGLCLASKIAPIFFNTLEDAGALPIEIEVNNIHMGDIIDIYPYKGEVRNHNNNELLGNFIFKNNMLINAVRAGGRISLIIGRDLTEKASKALNRPNNNNFFLNISKNIKQNHFNVGFSLAQKIVGHACGIDGVYPGTYCEPKITSIGSQDTTGPMTRDELKDLACLKFSADLVIQSFCHTAAYPKLVDINTHNTLPQFMMNRGGISLRPGDGIIHSWLNRMLLPDTVGTGGDSHTRFPIGISFPAGSGLVAFAAATGIMPLNMPESVMVRFTGNIRPGITLRDLVHAIPLHAMQQSLLSIKKENKKNIFSGRVLEIEGLSKLKVEQAFELTNSSAERSATACSIQLDKEPIIEYLTSNLTLLNRMIETGYGNQNTLKKRIKKIKSWLSYPTLLQADNNASYVAVINIDLSKIKEPILCVPNDPDDVRVLSDIPSKKIDEVFIGSCMTNIEHFYTVSKILNLTNSMDPLPTRLWIAPPTKMDQKKLNEEGCYEIFLKKGARIEMPGCSLCMGNQARVKDHAVVVSTSTRNFPNRLGYNAQVYLASAELAAIVAILGRLPSIDEYMNIILKINTPVINI